MTQREQFEAWYCDVYWNFKATRPNLWDGSEYDKLDVQLAWNSWQAAQATQAQVASDSNGGMTGWPPGLLQDDCRALSDWMASRPDCMYRLRELYASPPDHTAAMRLALEALRLPCNYWLRCPGGVPS